MITLDYHPIANGFPLATSLEFESLKSNIQEHGLIHPIILYEGKILDGRNRFNACRALNIEAKYETFTGTYQEAFEFSNSMNASRRHLTAGQKAVIAAKAVIATREGDGKNLSVKRASVIYGTNDKYIQRAMKLIAHEPKLAERVFEGSITLAMAEDKYFENNRDRITQDQKNKGLIMNTNGNALDEEEHERYQYLKERNQHELILMLMRQEGTLKGYIIASEDESGSI